MPPRCQYLLIKRWNDKNLKKMTYLFWYTYLLFCVVYNNFLCAHSSITHNTFFCCSATASLMSLQIWFRFKPLMVTERKINKKFSPENSDKDVVSQNIKWIHLVFLLSVNTRCFWDTFSTFITYKRRQKDILCFYSQ